MKKFLFVLFVISFVICNVSFSKQTYNAQVNLGMQMYKNQNYTGCLQTMYDVVHKDPSNTLAYYYIAISQARLGDVTKAQEAYQRVIDLNTSSQLSKYSQNGIECLQDSTKCKSKITVGTSKKAIDNVNLKMEESRIEAVKDIVNQNKNVQGVPVEYMREFKDYSLPKNQLQNKSAVPTKEEIADALDTLKRAGYQNYLPQPQMTKEQMQMSMINSLNANNGYNNQMNNYMPYMANPQEMSQMSPELIQTMMMGSMMNGLYTDYNQR